MSSRSLWSWRGGLVLAAAIVLLDQVSKWATVEYFVLGQTLVITDFFNLTRVHNPGAAFSFLASAGGWQRWFFIALGLAAIAFMLSWLRSPQTPKGMALALSCIIGGALGNVIDRVVHGHVIDMLDFHAAWLARWFMGGHYPTFNVADAAITVGAVGLLCDELFRFLRSR